MGMGYVTFFRMLLLSVQEGEHSWFVIVGFGKELCSK